MKVDRVKESRIKIILIKRGKWKRERKEKEYFSFVYRCNRYLTTGMFLEELTHSSFSYHTPYTSGENHVVDVAVVGKVERSGKRLEDRMVGIRVFAGLGKHLQ